MIKDPSQVQDLTVSSYSHGNDSKENDGWIDLHAQHKTNQINTCSTDSGAVREDIRP
jgi:anti-sigma regulatory factor (Ser/Thr protein kinase)